MAGGGGDLTYEMYKEQDERFNRLLKNEKFKGFLEKNGNCRIERVQACVLISSLISSGEYNKEDFDEDAIESDCTHYATFSVIDTWKEKDDGCFENIKIPLDNLVESDLELEGCEEAVTFSQDMVYSLPDSFSFLNLCCIQHESETNYTLETVLITGSENIQDSNCPKPEEFLVRKEDIKTWKSTPTVPEELMLSIKEINKTVKWDSLAKVAMVNGMLTLSLYSKYLDNDCNIPYGEDELVTKSLNVIVKYANKLGEVGKVYWFTNPEVVNEVRVKKDTNGELIMVIGGAVEK